MNLNNKVIYTVLRYNDTLKKDWDQFVVSAKNATFLFQRDFMDYHKDRFEDFSLLIYKENRLCAVLPSNVIGNTVYSHKGLSYGGLVITKKSKLEEVSTILCEVLSFLQRNEIDTLQLKLLPSIYHQAPSDEIAYLLFILKAKLIRADIASTVELSNPIKILSNRIEGVKKGQKNGLAIKEGADFSAFWNEILIPNLKERHNAEPVHSLSEIKQLASAFPNNITQFDVYKNEKIVAGATIFETKTVAHVQYISANSDKQQLGSLDFLFEYLLKSRYSSKKYFDFGISNEHDGLNVNKGLQYWKECFGGRGIVHYHYSIETNNYTKLKDIFI